MPVKATAKTKKKTVRPAAKRRVLKSAKKVGAPRALDMVKKATAEKKTIRRQIVAEKRFEANILNSFRVHPVPDFVLDVRIVSAALPKEKNKIGLFPVNVSRFVTKVAALFLIVMLNWFGLSAVGRTFAYLSDTETSQNSFQASSLDFSLNGKNFFPAVTPSQNATSTVHLLKDGLMDLTYDAEVQSASGTLCAFLELEDNLTHVYKPLSNFISATTTLAVNSNLIFDARLTSASKNLQNKMCEFKFTFDGVQLAGAGFNDSEKVSRSIRAGEWPGIVINKVYYDPDEEHSGNGSERKYEWIELYNQTGQPVNLKNWQICDNVSCETINTNNAEIPALGYALLAHDNSVWEHLWNVPDNVVKINLGGNDVALNNDADMLVLLNADDAVADQMNWGRPNHSWANYAAYSAGIWEPGVAGAAEGHMFGRVPSGLDTDSVADWQDLSLPRVAMIYPTGGEVWYVGHAYNIQWTASSTNGLDSDLKIDLYYSNNSGQSWAAIATSTENDGIYNWSAPLFLDYGHYYVPSSHSRIKVVATGPENFMVQATTNSEDFCPPIDYDALSPEDQQLVNQLVKDGVIDESEVIRGGIKAADILAGMASSPEETKVVEIPLNGQAQTGTHATADNHTITEQTSTSTAPEIISENTDITATTTEIISEPAIEAAPENTSEITAPIAEEPATGSSSPEIITETASTTAEAMTDNQEILSADQPAVEPVTEPVIESAPPADSPVGDLIGPAAASPEPVVEAPSAPEPTPESAAPPDPAPAPEAPPADSPAS